MSDDEPDLELLALLRQSLGISTAPSDEVSTDTGVLRDAEHIYSNAVDVSIDMYGTKSAAAAIHKAMTERGYSAQAWSEQELHPQLSDTFSSVDMVNFIFTMDLLNFSFWSELGPNDRFQVEYGGKLWTGYNSLVACLRKSLDAGLQITSPRFWRDHDFDDSGTSEALKYFESATDEKMPMMDERVAILHEASRTLESKFPDPSAAIPETEAKSEENMAMPDTVPTDFQATDAGADSAHVKNVPKVAVEKDHDDIDAQNIVQETDAISEDHAMLSISDVVPESPTDHHGSLLEPPAVPELPSNEPANAPTEPDFSVVRIIESADRSAGKLVNLLAKHFPSFRDETRFEGRKVRFLKRAQIFVADLWAAFNGTSYGEFRDIDHLTMFADYRVPQMLHSLGILSYSPPLDHRIRSLRSIGPGHSWEVQLRGCSIWAVEMIRREIVRNNPNSNVNAVLIDFFLYDLAKEREAAGVEAIPHHRTRSIWY